MALQRVEFPWRFSAFTRAFVPVLSTFVAVCAIPKAYSQTTAININTSGNYTYSQTGNIETDVIGSGSGTVSPFGSGTVSGSFSINYGVSGNPLTGTFTFTLGSSGSFTVKCSTNYRDGATT